MPMKYYKENGQEYIENGNTRVRVETVKMQPSTYTQGRVLRIMSVLEVQGLNPANPIAVGNSLAVSFPESAVNAPHYSWSRGEEACVPMQVKPPVNVAQDQNLDPALL